MYGGHIVEDWDRRLANAYLAKYFNESLLEGIQLFPGFYLPPPTMLHPQVGVRNSLLGSTPASMSLGGRRLVNVGKLVKVRQSTLQNTFNGTALVTAPSVRASPPVGAGVHRGQHACRVGRGLWAPPQR